MGHFVHTFAVLKLCHNSNEQHCFLKAIRALTEQCKLFEYSKAYRNMIYFFLILDFSQQVEDHQVSSAWLLFRKSVSHKMLCRLHASLLYETQGAWTSQA